LCAHILNRAIKHLLTAGGGPRFSFPRGIGGRSRRPSIFFRFPECATTKSSTLRKTRGWSLRGVFSPDQYSTPPRLSNFHKK